MGFRFYRCPLCNRAYKSLARLKYHVTSEHSSFCNICFKPIRSVSHYLVLHDWRHLAVAEVLSSHVRFTCPLHDAFVGVDDIREAVEYLLCDGFDISRLRPVPGSKLRTYMIPIDLARKILMLADKLGCTPCMAVRYALSAWMK